jgi:hypothetical protein
MRELIIDAWQQRFQIMKSELKVCRPALLQRVSAYNFLVQAAVGQISSTMDIWSDDNLRPYMALTAHWIARVTGTSSLQLKAALIAFHRLRGNHDGETLAGAVLQLLDRAGITGKVRDYVLASNMTSLIYFQDWSFHNG